MFWDYYHRARFGGTTYQEVPFAGFQEGAQAADDIINGQDPTAATNDFMVMVGCYNIEGVFVLLDYMLVTEFYNYKNEGQLLTDNNTNFNYMFTLLINPIYDGLFGPMFETIIPTTEKEEWSLSNSNNSTCHKCHYWGDCFHSSAGYREAYSVCFDVVASLQAINGYASQ